MSWSRRLFRGGLAEDEIQPYREVDLQQLLQGPQETTAVAEETLEEIPAPSVEDLIAVAQAQAEELLARAKRQAEMLQQEAYEQAVARGREEGREEAKRELVPALVAFAQAGQSLIVLEEQLVSRFTPQLVCLALEIAEKVIGKHVENDPQIVASIVERAQAELPQARFVRIWVHPSDLRILEEVRPDLVHIGEKGGRKVEVVCSEEISRGGCRLETEMGTVDATIPVQMQEIRRQLLDEELE